MSQSRLKSNVNACNLETKWAPPCSHIRSTVVRLSSLTFISHLTALFSCPWQPNTSEALYMRWSHRMIYRLAMWAKAVCMLGSPGEFTMACSTLSTRGDTVAFQADEAMSSYTQRAFCSIQLLQNLLFCEMSRQSRTQVQLVFSEREDCCHTKGMNVNTPL